MFVYLMDFSCAVLKIQRQQSDSILLIYRFMQKVADLAVSDFSNEVGAFVTCNYQSI